jgi:isopropylmalate/homocitrate/citramalate synthase
VPVADAARFAADHGADVVYVVDSAGGLAPAAVTEYVTAAIEAGARAGYHGHDNTRFGLANAPAPVDAGAEYVDVSLQGTGRSAGNTQTALLCAQFLEDVPNRDWRRLHDLVSVVSSVYGEAAGVAIEDVLYGAAGLHSSFAPDLRQVAAEFDTTFTDVLATAVARGCSAVEAVTRAYESGGGRSASLGVDTSS